jgi:hypothetical protein
MVLIGIDPHKATHTAVAVDQEETALGECGDALPRVGGGNAVPSAATRRKREGRDGSGINYNGG